MTETVPNSDYPVMIRNEQTGQDEPAVRFRYNFGYDENADDLNKLPRYKEFQGGRSGQIINVSVDLPKSVATELQAQIARDPASVRTLAEKLFLENNDGRMTEEYWRSGGSAKNPIRPPYEKLPESWSLGFITSTEKVQESAGGFVYGGSDHQFNRLVVDR